MTDLCEATHCTVIAALENWARWCNRIRDCYPESPTNWQLFDQVEYKNCHQTTQEKLDEALEHKEPDELAAMRVERIVANMLDAPKRVAIRIHWVTMPDRGRHELGLTAEQWDERRARIATRRGGWHFTPQTYREAVDRAIDALEAML